MDKKELPISKFKDIVFKSEKEFSSQLTTNMKYIVELDGSQDLSKIWVHESGEILHCNMQASVWNGAFIDIKKSEEECRLWLYHPSYDKDYKLMDFIVEKIIEV